MVSDVNNLHPYSAAVRVETGLPPGARLSVVMGEPGEGESTHVVSDDGGVSLAVAPQSAVVLVHAGA